MKRPAFPSLSLMTKIPLTITLVVFASTLITGVVVIERDWARQRDVLETQTLALARATAAAGGAHVLNRDVWTLYRLLRQLQEQDVASPNAAPVIEAAFLEPDGTILAHSNPKANPVGTRLSTATPAQARRLAEVLKTEAARLLPPLDSSAAFIETAVPIAVDGVVSGYLLLRSSTAGLTDQVRSDAIIVLAFAIVLAAVMSLFGTWLSRRMVRPLQDLSQGLEAVGRGDFSGIRPAGAPGRDEIRLLTEHFNLMVRELAEKKRIERELEASERLAGLGRFAAGLAHEVNNPIGGMMNCVQTLSRNPDDGALVRRYLPLLDNGLRSIAATIKALLGELRQENQPEPCQTGCLNDLEALVRSEIGDRPIVLDWAVDQTELSGQAVRCTCPHIHQIVMNLARNAIAAMPEGGRLAFASRRVGDRLELTVADTGPGIDEETCKHLFEPFFSTRSDGGGLGLWIVFRIVRDMGGDIHVDGRPGQGARFTVSLPLEQAEIRPMGDRIRVA